jgi:hypothetical protein
MASEEGNALGPIDSITEREARIDSLPEKERELAQESSHFADLCSYFSRQRMDLPSQVVDELQRVARLELAERASRMRLLNEELMKHLSGLGCGQQTRQ